MKLYPLALTAGLLPLLTVHLCYLLAALSGHVNACIPYIHSCTSISSAGRVAPEFYIFKGMMIPAAVIIFMFWLYVCQWLKALGSSRKILPAFIIGCGLVACLGLIMYSVVLGAIGPEFRVQRRIGVITFFALSFVAQSLFTYALSKMYLPKITGRRELRLVQICLAIIVLFAISAVVISSIDSDVYDNVEDAFEWWVTLLLCCFPLLVAALWRTTDFRTAVSVTVQ